MKLIVASILCLAAVLAAMLSIGQKPFAAAIFEYGVYGPYTGVIEQWPAPMLSTQDTSYLLVPPGKHGATSMVRGLEGWTVSVEGSLVKRGPYRMLEIQPGSLRPESQAGKRRELASLGKVELTGEIVDTKCYLGVMNPGVGKVHRQCAARCISGGVPPALAVGERLILLTGSDNRNLNSEVLNFAGERIKVGGELLRVGSFEVLRAEPKDFRRE